MSHVIYHSHHWEINLRAAINRFKGSARQLNQNNKEILYVSQNILM